MDAINCLPAPNAKWNHGTVQGTPVFAAVAFHEGFRVIMVIIFRSFKNFWYASPQGDEVLMEDTESKSDNKNEVVTSSASSEHTNGFSSNVSVYYQDDCEEDSDEDEVNNTK